VEDDQSGGGADRRNVAGRAGHQDVLLGVVTREHADRSAPVLCCGIGALCSLGLIPPAEEFLLNKEEATKNFFTIARFKDPIQCRGCISYCLRIKDEEHQALEYRSTRFTKKAKVFLAMLR
jgi:hypothetical protein